MILERIKEYFDSLIDREQIGVVIHAMSARGHGGIQLWTLVGQMALDLKKTSGVGLKINGQFDESSYYSYLHYRAEY